jgi:hypothetical protein
LSAATDAESGALGLLSLRAYTNLIRPKPTKIEAHQSNPESQTSMFVDIQPFSEFERLPL